MTWGKEHRVGVPVVLSIMPQLPTSLKHDSQIHPFFTRMNQRLTQEKVCLNCFRLKNKPQ